MSSISWNSPAERSDDRTQAAFAAEWRKARRSRVPALTLVVFTVPAAVAALFMFIIANPDQARDFGLLNQKAQLSGVSADWSGMLTFTAQVVAVGSLLLFSFIATWVFGREFSDGTIRYLLALPVRRAHIVAAEPAPRRAGIVILGCSPWNGAGGET